MSIVTTSEVRIDEFNGHYWADHSAVSPERLRPLAGAVGELILLARVRTDASESGSFQVDVEGVRVMALPDYRGLPGLMRALPMLLRVMKRLPHDQSAFTGRLPEPLALLLFLRAWSRRRPWISQVVSEPRQLGRSLGGRHAGPVLGAILAAVTRFCIRRSVGVIYVTQHWLQRLYPAPAGIPTIARSNVQLGSGSFVPRIRTLSAGSRLNLISIGSLTGATKGFDVAIDVVLELRNRGVDVTLEIVGDGHGREQVQELASRLGVQEHVHFAGHISDPVELRRRLDAATVYLSTSRAEGLSRAMIEAMARALPVVATASGGAAELVSETQLVPVGDVTALADAIEGLIRSDEAYATASLHSLDTARAVRASLDPDSFQRFLETVLSPR
jgi:hypothetical protein